MKFTPRIADSRDEENVLYNALEPVAKGLGMAVLELSVFRQKKGPKAAGSERSKSGRLKGSRLEGNLSKAPGTVQVRITVYKNGNMGVDDCSRFHRAILPRLELVFPGNDLSLEVSSPGISRLIKDGREMVFFIGRGIKCYCTDVLDRESAAAGTGTSVPDGSGWIGGILSAADEKEITLETGEGKIILPYENIAKAKLDENIN